MEQTLSDPKTYVRNQYLNHLVDPSFQRGNRLFVLLFENENGRRSYSKVEVKDCNIMIDGKNFFDQPVNNNFKTYANIRKISIGQGHNIELVAC